MRLLITVLKLLAHLPTAVLYLLSNVFGFMLRDVIHYRSKIITQNLQRSFPSLDTDECKMIRNAFYRNLSDIIVETIRLWTISEKELLKRVEFSNPQILEAYERNGKNVIIMMGHSGNWEWAGAATAARFSFSMIPVYRKVKNHWFNTFFIALRSKFGSTPMLDKDCAQKLPFCPTPSAVAMLADQTSGSRKGWWLTFLNQKTPFYRGSEILARRLNQYDVVFAHVHRVKRGQYSIELKESPVGWREEEHLLTKSFASFLEDRINMDKANWLWSHNRWKHQHSENSIDIDV